METQKKRRGRPPKENARNCDINIRLTAQELEKIERLASIKSVTRTDAIMQAVTDALERLTD